MDITLEKIAYNFVKFGEGDEKAFSFFYKYFINDLYAYGRSLGVDETNGDDKTENTHAIQLMRYAEILLNYAEAKAELGTLTNDDWSRTIGALRSRAGITGGLNVVPTNIDLYLQKTYFPNISNPSILEIRRERAIELVLEGFRFDDLRRWKSGNLLTMSWTGMYISDINKPLDVDHDGTHDVIYYLDDAGLNEALRKCNDII